MTLYRGLRNALFVSLAFAAVSYALLPMAPPRLVPDIGIADTVGLAAGHDTGSFGGVVPFNPYAAMPSMHVGWSLLVGIFGFRALRGNTLRWLFALHPWSWRSPSRRPATTTSSTRRAACSSS